MALNPLRVQMPGEQPGDSAGHLPSRFGSFPMQPPGAEEFARLQELLAQALKREADAHRKMKHLYDQLMEARTHQSRSLSEGSQSGTPDILWDSELSQTSEGSPHSLTPALIVVSASPTLRRKSPSLSAPAPQQQVYNNSPPQTDQLVNHLNADDGHITGQLSIGLTLGLEQGQLAPSPQDYRGVRREREKPPPSLSPVLLSASSRQEKEVLQSPLVSSSATTSPSLELNHVAVEDREEDRFSQSLGAVDTIRRLSPDVHSQRLDSTKNRRKKVGQRARSNTTNILPNWIRRRREAADRIASPSSSSRALQRSPVDSIEEMFGGFVRTTSTSIQQDRLAMYIDHHWSEVCKESSCSADTRKYRDAVWDLVQAETKFLTRFLQPLEQVYKGFLEELHFHGVLKVADVDKIFANLSELCELSSSVAHDLFKLFEGHSGNRIAPNNELILAFSMFGHKFNPVYQRFCVNFEKQRGLIRALGQLPDFKEYLRVCRTHETVGKNDLSALLIAPMSHQCHYQLLLEKILKHTKDKSEKELLSSAIKAFVVSLKELEANIEDSKRSAEMLELQETLSWPTLSQLEPGAYIPEALGSQLSSQPCSYVLASKDRQLVYHGPLKLLDGKHPCDVVAFLFTDSLLLTQQNCTQGDKKVAKKESLNQLTRYSVLGHPMLLTMLDIHDIPFHQHRGHLITLIERNLFKQQVGLYSLQAPAKEEKVKWLSQLTHTKNIICYRNSPSYIESDV